MLYHSTNLAGQDVAASGALLVPAGPPPAGGWPVVSWAHGTTGMADRCAPSQTPNLFYNEYADEVSTFLRAGYAVAAADFLGLGTPGVHTYLIGVDEGNAVVDIVTAMRALVPHLRADWFAVGHSQGGQAALFAAALPARHPDLHLRGTVAIAPASGLDVILPAAMSGGDPAVVAYGVYVLIGLAAADPTVSLPDLLGLGARDRLPLITDRECLDQTDAALKDLPPDQTFRIPPARLTELNAELARVANPDGQPVAGPVLVVQGGDDGDVPPAITQNMVQRLQAKGVAVVEREYPGLGHDAVLGPSICDRLAWMAGRGGPVVTGCRPHPTRP